LPFQVFFNQDSVACPAGTLYTIKPGDSLYSLAARFNTSINAIVTANPGINPTNLQLGQQICIPVTPAPGPCPGGFLHTVTISDTFYSIARRYGIAVPALAAANPGVDPNRLRIGQQICVPAPAPAPIPCPGRSYTVQPGDTLIGIARREGYTLDALIAVNPGIDPNRLRAGQIICLPPSPGGGPFACYGGSIYIIRPGDTFYSIARRFGVSLDHLLEANPETDPDRLRVGDPVCIPR
jgi:LysM repeat protein